MTYETLSMIGDAGAPSIDDLDYVHADPAEHAAIRDACEAIAADLDVIHAQAVVHAGMRSPETRVDLTLFGAPEVTYAAPSGAPAGWSAQAPDATALPRHATRVTRSRKGRTSFVATGRERFGRTTGDASLIGPTVDGRSLIGRADETALVADADRILRAAFGEIPRGLKLTDRQDLQGSAAHCNSQRIGGRDYRGARWWSLPIDGPRSEHWCDFHDAGAEHCECALMLPASVGTIENGGAHAGTDDKLDWSTRSAIDASRRPCPLCNITPRFHHAYEPVTVERENKRTGAVESVERCGHLNTRGRPCNGVKRSHAVAVCERQTVTIRDGAPVVELVAYDDACGGWVGHRRIVGTVPAGSYGKPTTRVARAAVKRAADELAARRESLSASLLPAIAAVTRDAPYVHPDTGAIVSRDGRKYRVTLPSGDQRPSWTPAAVVGILASIA